MLKDIIVGLILTIFPLTGFCGTSSVQQRTSYNSEKQQVYFVGGNWGFTNDAYASFAFAHGRTPVSALDVVDTFYQENGSLGYAMGNMAIDLGIQLSQSPLTQIYSIGGQVGITYIHIAESSDPESHSDQALGLLHQQSYAQTGDQTPVFWARASYSTSKLESKLIDDLHNRGEESILTLDVFYPAAPDFLLGAGFAIYGYENNGGLFTNALKSTSDTNLFLLGATVQGLPASSLHFDLSWQVAPRDSFQPRYQATQVLSINSWTHTLDLGWKHSFSKHWQMQPTYEISVQNDRAFSGILMDLIYTF